MQREVEVEVSNVDRVGAFLGNIYILGASTAERVDVSSLLLSTGHGYIHESFDPSRDRLGARYAELEKESREANVGFGLITLIVPLKMMSTLLVMVMVPVVSLVRSTSNVISRAKSLTLDMVRCWT